MAHRRLPSILGSPVPTWRSIQGSSASQRLPSQAIRPLRTSSAPRATYRRFGQPAPSSSPAPPPQSHNAAPTPLNLQTLQDILVQRTRANAGGGGGEGGGGNRRPRGRGFQSRPTLLFVVGGGAGVYYLVHLERVPETGRWRFIDVSREQEVAMGQDSYRQVLQQYRGKILPPNHPHSRHVRKTAERIIAALEDGQHSDVKHGSVDAALGSSGGGGGESSFFGATASDGGPRPKTDWELFVIDEPSEKNAFVLPGGKVFVFTGILPITANDDGLATVLGHEVAHQVARHSAEKVSGYKVLMFGALVLESLLGIDAGLSRTALTLLLSLPNSRKTELEADQIGLSIMAKACYDPREAARLWQRMQQSEGEGGGGGLGDAAKALLSTHPVSSQRIKKMQEWLPDAMSTRSQSGCPNPDDVSGFRSVVGGSRFGSAFG
ncbi:uncharacterized protein PFL1_02950 [Pseudozyma flocculosa PF-1]|uniref:Related to OMA1 - Metalloendopeptidase of the mitochondrial inner membrane n=2 Tax=Pseudozyma flocculosa TaxID=84751 RepID=A0A5C3F1J9_9BASI|nr:uncharacterized protein PFL1_02950 [Pseudozyma flocculosa PF-1]EPQ29730.1 hypothetical protein PFL1_02950 [Pseudozyma flocculosa PF-1]SPO38308.1 related to OMA1 - Metalloendopeptidase of the mitochondrial inner membrane [Pseudozyma flocculosa]